MGQVGGIGDIRIVLECVVLLSIGTASAGSGLTFGSRFGCSGWRATENYRFGTANGFGVPRTTAFCNSGATDRGRRCKGGTYRCANGFGAGACRQIGNTRLGDAHRVNVHRTFARSRRRSTARVGTGEQRRGTTKFFCIRRSR